jgi:hypothetical protein
MINRMAWMNDPQWMNNLNSRWEDRTMADGQTYDTDPRYQIGARVMLVENVGRYPHALVKVGETGTVSAICHGQVCVRLDTHHPGLAEWNNELVFDPDDDPFHADQYRDAVRLINGVNDETVGG